MGVGIITALINPGEDKSKSNTLPVAAQEGPVSKAQDISVTKAQDKTELAPVTEAAPETPWNYQSEEDPMSGKMTTSAMVFSTNKVNFDFPYNGPQFGRLTLRSSPRYGKDVIFQIEKGQLLCSAYDGCTVLVRFDDHPAQKFSALEPNDNSTETLFITGYKNFVTQMTKAKRVRISANVYQEGSPVFEFDVSNFDQNRFKAGK